MPTETRLAEAAGEHRLHGNPVTDVDAPTRGRAITDLGDSAERLMAGNHRQIHLDHAVVLLEVAAADTAGLEFEDRRVLVDIGDRHVAGFELAGSGLHHGER